MNGFNFINGRVSGGQLCPSEQNDEWLEPVIDENAPTATILPSAGVHLPQYPDRFGARKPLGQQRGNLHAKREAVMHAPPYFC